MQAPPPKRPFWPRQVEGTSQHFYSTYSTEFQRGRGRGRGRGQRGHPTGGRGRGRGTTTALPDPPQFWCQKGEYSDPIHTLSACTCGRSIDSFSPAVTTDHHRFVGARDYWRWLCTRVCAKSTSIFGYSINESFKSDPVKHHAEGGQFSVVEKCCATGADRGGTRGLLQHNVFGEPGFSSSTRRQVSQVKPCDSRGFVSKEYGKCLSNSQNSGFDGLSLTTGPLGEIAHEAHSTLPISFLETIEETNSISNSVKRPSFSSSEMVAEQTKCYDRNNLNNRRLSTGGWGGGGGGGGVIADRK